MNGLLGLNLEGAAFLAAVDVVAGAVVLTLLVLLLRSRSRLGAAVTVGAILCGAVLGWVVAWFVGDVADVFGVALSTPTRMWSAAVFAGVGLVISGFVFLRGRSLLVPALALPLCLLAAAAGINADVGEFPTLRTALGVPVYQPLRSAVDAADSGHGTVGTVTIPATVSKFPARPAMIYLPPVLRTAHPPALPVIEALSGQPGSPENLFTSGHLASVLDAWAARHHGVAPIVVAPDQLGSPEKNPMCVDSALGNSATYLTVDVPRWIRSHYSVAPAPGGWAIAGFSQGGTCSIQLGAAHPTLFGTVFDISGEERPGSRSPDDAVRTGFAGSRAAYAAAAPAAVLAAHAPDHHLRAVFVAGREDARYLGWARTLAAAATRAGAETRLIVSPGTGHDWHTVHFALTAALPLVAHDLGLR
jgi:enterochelin esterase-like enzyme